MSNIIEFGDYLFIEEDFKVVALADFFKTLPIKYEYLRKKYSITGKASKMAILVGQNMNPEQTIVLEKKPERIKTSRPVPREMDMHGLVSSDTSELEKNKKNQQEEIRRGIVELPFDIE